MVSDLPHSPHLISPANRLVGSFGQVMGAVDHNSPEALFALMLTLPAQVVVGHTLPVIEEEGQLQLPFLAHSRHGASYHRKSAHFSRNGRDGRIAVFGVMFRGDSQGKCGHRAAWKSPIVSRGQGRLRPADLSCLGSVLVSVLPGFPDVVPAPESHSSVLFPLVRSLRSRFLQLLAAGRRATSPESISHQAGHSIGIIHR